MAQSLVVQFPGGKRVDVKVGDFLVQTDQSVKAGGEASAPEPYALFLSSLVACAGIFALNFCTSRNLSTEGLALSMGWERDPKAPANAKAQFRLRVPEGFPEKYRAGILRAMDLCAVKKTMENPPEFTSVIEN